MTDVSSLTAYIKAACCLRDPSPGLNDLNGLIQFFGKLIDLSIDILSGNDTFMKFISFVKLTVSYFLADIIKPNESAI